MEWRQIEDLPAYEVSEWGDVRRVVPAANRSIGDRPRGFVDADGYLRYRLTDARGRKQTITAYRLVALAFIGPPPSEVHEVAHNNGSRTCAYHRELRWALRVDNHADMQVHGTSTTRGELNPKAKITEADVRVIRREYRDIKNSRGDRRVTELERRFGLHRSTIISIAKGTSWGHVPMEVFQ